MPEPKNSMISTPPQPAMKHHTPEANNNALRCRATNDWFRHDAGPQVVSPPSRPLHHAAPTQNARESARKTAGEPELWFAQAADCPDGNRGAVNGSGGGSGKRKPPVQRCRTAEARQNFHKIKGTDEGWYKHDGPSEYVRPKNRVQTPVAAGYKTRNLGRESTEWYRHEHESSAYTPPKSKQRTPSKTAESNAHRLRPTGTPSWASYDKPTASNGHPESLPIRAMSRLTTHDAEEYHLRNRNGNDWFTHDHTPDPVRQSPRVMSPEGLENATKWRNESDSWFDHDKNQAYRAPLPGPRCSSASARKMIELSRGNEINNVMKHEKSREISPMENHTRSRGDDEEFAQKSGKSMIDKYMQEDNKNHNGTKSEINPKPEAAEYAERNKGTLNILNGDAVNGNGVAVNGHGR